MTRKLRKYMKALSLLFCAVVFTEERVALAEGKAQSDPFCYEEAGRLYSVPPLWLWAISKVESGFNPEAINRSNKNGSLDYGLMQINSYWADVLGHDLWYSLSDPCTNIKTGAFVLSDCVRRHGYTWKAIGCYNSPTLENQRKYAAKVIAVIAEVENQQQARCSDGACPAGGH